MGPKKQKKSKKVDSDNVTGKQLEIEDKSPDTHDSHIAQESEPGQAESEQPAVTTTNSAKTKSGGKRGVCATHKKKNLKSLSMNGEFLMVKLGRDCSHILECWPRL